jgi:hypothetical protein
MGWLFKIDMLHHQTPAEYIAEHFSSETDDHNATVLATATESGTIYAAIRNEDKTTGVAYVLCGVFLFKNNRRDGFGYKSMTETMGPTQVNCPDRIMRLLSPVEEIPDPSYAAEWRSNVAAAKERRRAARKKFESFQEGDTVRLPYSVQFSKSGVSADAFTFLGYRGRTPIFTPISNPYLRCRLSRTILAAAVVEGAAT